jgi:hypothetical protein
MVTPLLTINIERNVNTLTLMQYSAAVVDSPMSCVHAHRQAVFVQASRIGFVSQEFHRRRLRRNSWAAVGE